MFDISVLKEMKLSELQEIAKATKKIKFNGVKKEELVYKILDYQAANPQSLAPSENPDTSEPKGKRMRIQPDAKEPRRDQNTLFSPREDRFEPRDTRTENQMPEESGDKVASA